MNLKDKEKKINQAKKVSLSLSLSLSHATPKIYKLDEKSKTHQIMLPPSGVLVVLVELIDIRVALPQLVVGLHE